MRRRPRAGSPAEHSRQEGLRPTRRPRADEPSASAPRGPGPAQPAGRHDATPRARLPAPGTGAPIRFAYRAGVAELADAPGLGPGGLRPLEVRFLSPASPS